ncbi:MAG: TetR/AcrR family transcriptional regulator [Chloroflexota bacterium]
MAKHDNLSEACVLEAFRIIESDGVDNLSLRAVSRRLGVSHQAPYKHFESRDHILAEVVRRTFDRFAKYLEQHPTTDDPHADMRTLGEGYLQYAIENPAHYRLMFGTVLPPANKHPSMMKSAQKPFLMLTDCVERVWQMHGVSPNPKAVQLDALFIWSSMHGMASIMQTTVMDTLKLPQDVLDTMTDHAMFRISRSIGYEADSPDYLPE